MFGFKLEAGGEERAKARAKQGNGYDDTNAMGHIPHQLVYKILVAQRFSEQLRTLYFVKT